MVPSIYFDELKKRKRKPTATAHCTDCFKKIARQKNGVKGVKEMREQEKRVYLRSWEEKERN